MTTVLGQLNRKDRKMTQVVMPNLRPLTVSLLTDNSQSYTPVGYRLAVVSWKTPKAEMGNTEYKRRSSVCAAVPVIEVAFDAGVLKAALQGSINDMQDMVLRDYVNQMIELDTSVNLIGMIVPSELFTQDGLAHWYSSQSVSGKLSKEMVASWFTSQLEGPLTTALSAIPGISEEKLKAAVKQHKELLVKLSSPQASLPVHVATQLQKALLLSTSQDKVRTGLERKLEGFMKPKTADDLLLSL